LFAHPLVFLIFELCCNIYCVAAFSYYYEDPGGLIPSWIINWAAKVLRCSLITFYIFSQLILISFGIQHPEEN